MPLFQPGNSGRKPGSRNKAVVKPYLEAFGKALSIPDWTKIIKVAIEQAKDGDRNAREWLTRCLIGDNPFVVQQLKERVEAYLEGEQAKHAIPLLPGVDSVPGSTGIPPIGTNGTGHSNGHPGKPDAGDDRNGDDPGPLADDIPPFDE